ncbi:MAG TPA: phosphoribosylformylglycinamidine synthase subunit PurS [Armatimonadota bacterium]|jgi:phosphoribosylformylglycinamidine synthase PurS subunit|nr:phosphoribosylformylglycinamidine synthase subunit PurS [Armatimonadota bacterium]HPP73629.1 phosphoribosylformylglycinamidine synthase subunit PurS [Armatimonadota bacterium]
MAKVKVYVTLKPSLLDAQGRVVQTALENLGYGNVEDVRIGKYIELEVKENGQTLDTQIEEMCRKLLANPVIENYRFEVTE